MGIYDRDYYRREGPSILDQMMPSGLVCRWLIGINIVVFALQWIQSSGSMVTDWLVLDTAAVMRGEVWRLLTYAFLHYDLWHILFNMLFLWWFGSDLEQLYGRAEFLTFYLVAALCGGGAYEVWSVAQGNSLCMGASGAVMALLVLCALHFPNRSVYLFMLIRIPIWLLAVIKVVQDVVVLMSQTRGGGLLQRSDVQVAVIVHLAGAGFAWAYYKMHLNFTASARGLLWWKRSASEARLKIFDPEPDLEEPVAVSAGSASVVMDEHLEAKLDAVLEKIARNGKDSLTQKEQQILQQAAEMYKRRRS